MTSHESPRRPGWQTGDVLRTAALVFAVYGAVRLFLFAHILFFAAFLGVLFGLAVASGVDGLRRFHIPRGLGAGAIVIGFVAILVGFGAWTGPTVRSQYGEIRQRLPATYAKLDHWIGERQGGLLGSVLGNSGSTADSTEADTSSSQDTATNTSISTKPDSVPSGVRTDSLTHIQELKHKLMSRVGGGAGRFVFPVITSTFAALSGIILVLFLSVYIGADPDTYRNGILALIPAKSRRRWEQVLDAASKALRRWLVTQLIAMLVIGGVSTAVLFLLGVRAALPLGILAGLLEFVPTVGPILSAVPAIAMAFSDGPEKAAAVAVAYVGIQFLENHILIPLLMKEGSICHRSSRSSRRPRWRSCSDSWDSLSPSRCSCSSRSSSRCSTSKTSLARVRSCHTPSNPHQRRGK